MGGGGQKGDQISIYQVQRMEDVDKGREQPPEYLEPVFPKIPDEFWDKVGMNKAKGKTGGKRKGRAKA